MALRASSSQGEKEQASQSSKRLMASASDDGSVHVFHAKAADDFSNPVIVPVKRLRGHVPKDDFGVLAMAWHPTQPWVLTAGADAQCFLGCK